MGNTWFKLATIFWIALVLVRLLFFCLGRRMTGQNQWFYPGLCETFRENRSIKIVPIFPQNVVLHVVDLFARLCARCCQNQRRL